MTLETQEYRSILHTSRPLRYAFIVDLEASEISKQLTDIFQFSARMWGGRLNTIIPLLKGEISQAWWQILKICDPDKVRFSPRSHSYRPCGRLWRPHRSLSFERRPSNSFYNEIRRGA